MTTVKKKTIRINIVLLIMTILYSIFLLLCSTLITDLKTFKSNLQIAIEQSWRQQARLTLADVINEFEYAVENEDVDANNVESVSKWCSINYSGIRNGGLTSDGFVIELNSDMLIVSDYLVDLSKPNSIHNHLSISDSNYKNFELVEDIIEKIKTFSDTKYNDNYYWINNGQTEWLEWKTYPTNVLGKDDYYSDDGETSSFNKYVFVLSTNKNEIYAYYSFMDDIDLFIKIINYSLIISLCAMIITIFYVTYNEFNKNESR